jgi:hypothetical protein
VEVNKLSRAGVAEEMEPIFAKEADGRLEDPKASFRQPTPADISRLVFAKLRDLRVHAQEARNHFAHLLNRGSSME